MSITKTNGDRKALILLVAMLCVWLAGATVPMVAMLPAWTDYTMIGTDQERSAMNWRASSFTVGSYNCYPYVSAYTASPSGIPLNITVFDDSGVNIFNLTYSLFGAGAGTARVTITTTAYNSTHRLIAVLILFSDSAPANTGIYVYSFLCDGATLTLLYSHQWIIWAGSTLVPYWLFMSGIVEGSAGFYVCATYRVTGYIVAVKFYCVTHNYQGDAAIVASSANWFGLPYIFKLSDAAVYAMMPGCVDRLDTTTETTLSVLNSSFAFPIIDVNGTWGSMVSNITYDPVSLAISACYFQNMVPSGTYITYYSCYWNGAAMTRTTAQLATGLTDTAYYLDWQAGYTEGLTPWFVCVNTTGGTLRWLEVIMTLNAAGGIISITNTTLGTVEAVIQTAKHLAWSTCWTNEPYGGTNHPHYAVGYFTSGTAAGKYYKVVQLGSMALIDISQYGLPTITGTWYNVTYAQNSNVTKFFDDNVTQGFTNQMLTAEFIYLANVNTSLYVGAYHTLYTGNVSTTNSLLLIGSTTVPAGWSGWVVISGLNYYQPQFSQVGIAIRPANCSAGAFYSVGVPATPLLTDVFNLTVTGNAGALPSTIYVNNVTLDAAAQNLAVTYSLSYTAGGVNITYTYIATENVTMPTFNPTQYLFINASANYIAPVTNLGGTITLILETPWGPWLLAIIPIFIMILAGGSTGAVAAVLALAVSTIINFSVSTPVFRWGVLGVIAFITLLMLFDEGGKKRP